MINPESCRWRSKASAMRPQRAREDDPGESKDRVEQSECVHGLNGKHYCRIELVESQHRDNYYEKWNETGECAKGHVS